MAGNAAVGQTYATPKKTQAQVGEADTAIFLGPEWKTRYGRFTLDDGRKVSLRLLERNFVRFAPIYDISDRDIRAIENQINSMKGGGRRNQRGGYLTETMQIIKAASLYVAYKGADKTGRAAEYFKQEVIDPIFGSTSRVAAIIVKLADQVVIKTPVTAVVGSLAAVGFTANVAATIAQKFNTWARGVAAAALTDEAADRAAQVAVGDARKIATTAGIAALIANQVGILPMSILAATILRGLKVSVKTPVLRANVVATLYAWYLAQDQPTRNAIKAQAVEYANAAKDATVSGAEKTKQIAISLAPYLLATGVVAAGVAVAAPGAAAAGVAAAQAAVVSTATAAGAMIAGIQARIQGMNAFQAVVEILPVGVAAGAAVPVAAAVPVVPEDPAIGPAGNILAEGEPAAEIAAADAGAFGAELEAAANAAMQAEDAAAADADMPPAAPGAPAGGRKHRKTKKRAMRKRRITRRRPLFSY